LPEDGHVKPKHVAIECDFNGILKQRSDCEWFWVALEMEMSEQVMQDDQSQFWHASSWFCSAAKNFNEIETVIILKV
jgi:hypothetical protein